VAYGKGATLETIIGNFDKIEATDTGIFFKEQTVDSLLGAIEMFEREGGIFDKHIIRNNALRFSKERFEKEFEDKVNLIYKEWKQQ
jgi:hypothetical protein